MPEAKIIITDASCFIILQKLNAIHLLQNLFTSVITTPQIATEFGYPLPVWVKIMTVTNEVTFESLKLHLDVGEASAIALANEINHDYLILDDLKARYFAEQKGLKVKGTLGVLLTAKIKGIIPFLLPYLDALQQTNFRISKNLVQQILNDAGE
ncbi:DUF3368 domain-containing protein [Mucilaginibacter arboris]|uniref:DUF3368 domain-containing protein n=1 Tax=Mucilaginibacter arboris TaxID=2682090 RepID=A0A7K1SZ70_9SPHI|nr:DUF3368 domain-containing protein [Mucilaginibacter arboris]MVN22557.1 DUF3368 domain-containing protein [Mucilaginibacter arboris]